VARDGSHCAEPSTERTRLAHSYTLRKRIWWGVRLCLRVSMPAGEDLAVALVEWVPAAEGPGASTVVADARDPIRPVKPLGAIRRHLGVSSRPS
jgi:hypothetical protein